MGLAGMGERPVERRLDGERRARGIAGLEPAAKAPDDVEIGGDRILLHDHGHSRPGLVNPPAAAPQQLFPQGSIRLDCGHASNRPGTS